MIGDGSAGSLEAGRHAGAPVGQLRRPNDLEVDAEEGDAEGQPFERVVAGLIRATPASVTSLAGVLLLILFGYAFSWVFAFLGMLVSTPEAANSLGFMLVFPLTFISSAFVPVDSMPEALQVFAEVNPFTVIVDEMRELWVGSPGGSLWQSVAWSVAITAVFAPLAVWRYRKNAER